MNWKTRYKIYYFTPTKNNMPLHSFCVESKWISQRRRKARKMLIERCPTSPRTPKVSSRDSWAMSARHQRPSRLSSDLHQDGNAIIMFFKNQRNYIGSWLKQHGLFFFIAGQPALLQWKLEKLRHSRLAEVSLCFRSRRIRATLRSTGTKYRRRRIRSPIRSRRSWPARVPNSWTR